MIRNRLLSNRYLGILLGCIIPASALVASPTDLVPETISYKEALKLYHQQGGIENYRCTLLPADSSYQLAEYSLPVAVEIDDWLFVKLAGVIHILPQQHIIDSEVLYGSDGVFAKLVIKHRFNQSEYGESDDRFVELTLSKGIVRYSLQTVGTACGI